ncbi:MAG TPA: hypothetical protein VFA26_04160, partial [Gemmataceae bacterium]|nr:hypothetical protein [Gemmataceae bacterium]
MLTPRSLRFPLALCCALALAAAQARAAVVVLLDDSLSMAERRKDRDAPTCFDAAKRLVKGAAGRAARGERFLLLLATRPGKPIFDQPLDDESRRQLEKVLAETKCTVLRAEPRAGVEAAGKLLGGDGPRTLHVVSDFRARDWTGPEAAPLVRAVAALLSSGVNVNLVDAAGPLAEKAAPPENLAILELAPETRV